MCLILISVLVFSHSISISYRSTTGYKSEADTELTPTERARHVLGQSAHLFASSIANQDTQKTREYEEKITLIAYERKDKMAGFLLWRKQLSQQTSAATCISLFRGNFYIFR